MRGEKAPFTWNYREKTIKRIQIKVETQTMVISLDKQTESG